MASEAQACQEHGEDEHHGHPEKGYRLTQFSPQLIVTSLHG
jgi:hypothetical protein